MRSGVFPLRVTDNKNLFGDNEISVHELQKKIDGKYIIQQRIYQHPRSAGCIRIRLTRFDLLHCEKETRLFRSPGRFAWGPAVIALITGPVGGLALGSMSRRKLCDEGRFAGFWRARQGHPETGVQFSTYEIPYYQKRQNCTELHSFFYGVHSIGWISRLPKRADCD